LMKPQLAARQLAISTTRLSTHKQYNQKFAKN